MVHIYQGGSHERGDRRVDLLPGYPGCITVPVTQIAGRRRQLQRRGEGGGTRTNEGAIASRRL